MNEDKVFRCEQAVDTTMRREFCCQWDVHVADSFFAAAATQNSLQLRKC